MKWYTRFTQSPEGLLWGAFEDGQSFIAGVLAKISDETLRAQAKAAFDAAAAKDAVTLIGDSVLARADYSKNMDAIKQQDQELKDKLAAATALYEKNDAWYKANTAALTEYPQLKAKIEELEAGGGGGNGDGNKGGGAGMTKEEIAKLVNDTLDGVLPDRERGYVDVVAFMQDTGGSHLKMFGELPSMRELTANPKLGKPIVGHPGRVFSLQDAYNEKYGAEVEKKHKEAEEKRFEDEVQKRLGDARRANPDMPFPLRGTPPSVLDVLTTKEGSAAHTLDTAVAAYDALQANRG